MNNTLVLVFAKYPTPGTVKTRFVPPLTAREAAELHTHAFAAVCELVRSVAAGELVLVVSPDEKVDAFRSLLSNRPSQVWPQGTGDLGARMSRAIACAFDSGADRVILLGADSPTLPDTYLDKANSLLSDHAAVLGPSLDGGYYLIGMNEPHPKLFESVDWGSASVLEQTRALASKIGVDLVELPEWYDLDRFEDLHGAAADLAKISDDNLASRPSRASLRSLIDRLIERVDRHE